MGNCCGSQPIVHTPTHTHTRVNEYDDERYALPKIIITAEDAALIYFDTSPTYVSDELKYSLKRKFPNLISFDGEKRILYRIEMTRQRRIYLIIPGYIGDDTLRSLVISPKVRAIYFCLERMDFDQYSQSSKIKGFFQIKWICEKPFIMICDWMKFIEHFFITHFFPTIRYKINRCKILVFLIYA